MNYGKNDLYETIPFWTDGERSTPRFSGHARLDANVEADVCVIGGGMVGLSVAYELLLRGRSVVVLESSHFGTGETARSSAHLSAALEMRYFDLEHQHGEEGAKRIAESHSKAIDRIEAIVLSENIDCGFARVDGYLVASLEHTTALIEREYAAAQRAGLHATEIVADAPVLTLSARPCLRFPRQAQMDPAFYVAGLLQAIARKGGLLFGETHAQTIHHEADSVWVETQNGSKVTAKDVVVATNSPINNLLSVHTKQGAYRTYSIALPMPKYSIPEALYWDTTDPYHYVRLDTSDPNKDWLIVGGEDHKVGQEVHPVERWNKLEHWARSHFANLGPVASRWSGQVMESVDGVGYIGQNPSEKHVYIATGDTGNGMTHGAIAGMLIRDLICGTHNDWARIYDPARTNLSASGEFLRENLSNIAPYADWLAASEVAGEEKIARGQGAILRHGLTLLAAYRDPNGIVHRCSAVCPHLGGVVRWNESEHSWDCPCHGSRFDAYGKVIHGPANTDLGHVSKTELHGAKVDVVAPNVDAPSALKARLLARS